MHQFILPFLGGPGLTFTIDGGGSFKKAGSFTPDNSELTASVYPNPSTGQSRLDVRAAKGSSVEIGVYDVLGRAMFVLPQYTVDGKGLSLPLSFNGLPTGSYIVRVRNGARVVSNSMTLIR